MFDGGKGLKRAEACHRIYRMPKTLLLIFSLSILCSGAWSARAAGPPYTIAVIPKGTTHEFWKSINAGAVKAQRELTEQGTQVEIIWKGPLREDDRDQQ